MSATADQLENEPILLRADAAGITRLTLNRPAQYNALSSQMLEALQAALDDIDQDERNQVEGNGHYMDALPGETTDHLARVIQTVNVPSWASAKD